VIEAAAQPMVPVVRPQEPRLVTQVVPTAAAQDARPKVAEKVG
jgi:hypothetical protein